MAILDKLRSVGGAIKDRVAETFGEGRDQDLDQSRYGAGLEPNDLAPALDPAAARRVLEVGAEASLADVREAYRRLAHTHFGRARREGPESAAAGLLERALEALELLEQELLPLGTTSVAAPGRAAAPRRNRATPRAP